MGSDADQDTEADSAALSQSPTALPAPRNRARPVAFDATAPADGDAKLGLGATLASEPKIRGTGAQLQPGQSLGRYRLVELVGAGAMGVVWSAKDPHLDRRVAIKVVHSRHVESDDAAARFLREARAMAKVSDRSVVAVFDADQANDRLFIAMEFIDGKTLGGLIRERAPAELRDWRRWLRIMLVAGNGLAAAHRAGVLHRDFKPDNILVERNGRVCVSDFGLADVGDAPASRASMSNLMLAQLADAELTTTGALLGTPLYMSPEQLRGGAVDARADQFSFCVAAYEVLYGERPFVAELDRQQPLAAQLIKVIDEHQIRPAPKGSQVPAKVRQAILRGLAAKPDDRWPDMNALIDELRAALPSQRPKLAFAAAALAVATAAALLWATRHPTQPAPLSARPAPSILANADGHYVDGQFLLELPHPTKLAISPNGKRIAITAIDTVMVFDVDTKVLKQIHLASRGWFTFLDFFDNDTLDVAPTMPLRVQRWSLALDTLVDRGPKQGAIMWYGALEAGALVNVSDQSARAVLQVEGHPELRWTVEEPVEYVAISPDRRQFAYMISQLLVVVDVARNSVNSLPVQEGSAVAWHNNSDLWYASGIGTKPTIYQVSVGKQGFGIPQPVYQRPTGWIGQLLIANGHNYMAFNDPQFSGHTASVAPALKPNGKVAIPGPGGLLGWLDNGNPLTWDSKSLHVFELQGERRVDTGIVLDGDAANATRDGDTLIVTTRKPGGRKIAAFSLTTKKQLWSRNSREASLVRCAGDRTAPCFALAAADPDKRFPISRLDSATGNIVRGDFRLPAVEDFAISADGERIAIAAMTASIEEYTVSGKLLRAVSSNVANIRTIAYDGADAWWIGGAAENSVHAVQHATAAGRTEPTGLAAPQTVISLLRPSPDGKQLAYVHRTFDPRLFELKVRQ